MIKVRIEGASVLQAKLREYGKAVDKEAGTLIKEIAGAGAQNLASNTFPKGTTGKVKSVLIKSILKDMQRAYFAKGKESDSGKFLESRRGAKGRVARGKRKYISPGSFENIRKKKEKTAGEAKAAWLASGADLKKLRIPAWLKKSTKRGFSSVKRLSVILVNSVRYASSVINPADVTKSVGSAYKNYVKFIDRKMAALAKKV